MTELAGAATKLTVGDVVEIDGRRNEIVPGRQGGLTLEGAVTVTVAERDRRHGAPPGSQAEIDSHLDLLPGELV